VPALLMDISGGELLRTAARERRLTPGTFQAEARLDADLVNAGDEIRAAPFVARGGKQ